MNNRAFGFAAALAATVLAINPAAAVELVTNGGFEDGFSGWTQSGNTDYSGVGGGVVTSGWNAAFFGPVGSIGSISQMLSTVSGQAYDVSFNLKNNGNGTNSFAVFFGGGLADISYDELGVMPWTHLSFSGVATSATTLLQFSFRHDPSLWYLDDVSVQSGDEPVSPVPEPQSWAMMIAGFGLTGIALRRSRKRQKISALLFDHR